MFVCMMLFVVPEKKVSFGFRTSLWIIQLAMNVTYSHNGL